MASKSQSVLGHDRKTVYHSDLRSACEESQVNAIQVRLTGKRARVLDSKYQGKLPYAPFVLEGEDQEREYQVENDSIREVLNAAPEGEVLWIKASGGPSHEVVSLWTLDRTPIKPDGPPSSSSAPTPTPEPEPKRTEVGPGAARNGNGNGNGAQVAAPIAQLLWAAMTVGHEIIEAYEDTYGYPPAPAVSSTAMSIFIEFCKSNGRRPMKDGSVRRPRDRGGLDLERMPVGYRPWELPEPAAPATAQNPNADRDPVRAMAEEVRRAAVKTARDDDESELPF